VEGATDLEGTVSLILNSEVPMYAVETPSNPEVEVEVAEDPGSNFILNSY
jgi:hypothetical protein